VERTEGEVVKGGMGEHSSHRAGRNFHTNRRVEEEGGEADKES